MVGDKTKEIVPKSQPQLRMVHFRARSSALRAFVWVVFEKCEVIYTPSTQDSPQPVEGHIMTRLRFLLALMIGLMVAPGLNAAEKDSGTAHKRDGFFVSQFSDFRAVDGRHVVLYGGSRKKAFLATLFGYCVGLTHAEAIGIDSRLTYLSDRTPASIIVYDTFKQRCAISRLERVDNYAQAKSLVKRRKELAANAK